MRMTDDTPVLDPPASLITKYVESGLYVLARTTQ